MLQIFKRQASKYSRERLCKISINRVPETCHAWNVESGTVSGVDDAQYPLAGDSFNKNNNSAKLAGPPSRAELFYRAANSPTFARTCPAYWRKRSSVCSFPQWRRKSRGRVAQFDEIYYSTFRPRRPTILAKLYGSFPAAPYRDTVRRKARSHVLR